MLNKLHKIGLKQFEKNQQLRTMAVFKQYLKPITGQAAWQTLPDYYDYHQEVANAGFGDMLHDTERNQKYFAAIKKAIHNMHLQNRKVHVLDIGTGTGILAMMAVRAGADKVTACEGFMPMANCADRIFEANGMKNKIKLIKKRSTALTVGVGSNKDMSEKANLLVTEILDTELIGEGALKIYNHAHEKLLTTDAVCIPSRAQCYVQVACSPLAAQWNTLKTLTNLDGEVLLQPSNAILDCKGDASLHDIQLSQLPQNLFYPVTEATKVFDFDFTSKTPRKLKRSVNTVLRGISQGSTDLVFYWWSIDVDAEADIKLSCAPFWAHPDFKNLSCKRENKKMPLQNCIPWRDHWMQAIYYIPKPLHLTEIDKEFQLSCNHDEYSFWFETFPMDTTSLKPVPRHLCTCNFHNAFARNRIGQLNHAQRNKRFMAILEETVKPGARILVLGNGCVLGVATTQLGASEVLCCEPRLSCRLFMQSLVSDNELDDSVTIFEHLKEIRDSVLSKVTHVFAEPYFLTSILPWDNFYFGTQLMQIKSKLSTNVHVMPHKARILAVAVEFLDLHKIRAHIGLCEGFDISLFDEILEESSALAISNVEAQPLWEYPCRALSDAYEMLEVKFCEFNQNKQNSGEMSLVCDGLCNGVALWVDWHIVDSNSPKYVVTTGPSEPIQPGEFIKWDMFVKQGVYFIPSPSKVAANKSTISFSIDFQPTEGDLHFSFDLKV